MARSTDRPASSAPRSASLCPIVHSRPFLYRYSWAPGQHPALWVKLPYRKQVKFLYSNNKGTEQTTRPAPGTATGGEGEGQPQLELEQELVLALVLALWK